MPGESQEEMICTALKTKAMHGTAAHPELENRSNWLRIFAEMCQRRTCTLPFLPPSESLRL
jgi:hypothetical protein